VARRDGDTGDTIDDFKMIYYDHDDDDYDDDDDLHFFFEAEKKHLNKQIKKDVIYNSPKENTIKPTITDKKIEVEHPTMPHSAQDFMKNSGVWVKAGADC
jgi:hypothetical protein